MECRHSSLQMKAVAKNTVGAVIFTLVGLMSVVSSATTLRRNTNKGCDEQRLQQALSAISNKDYERACDELERLAQPKCDLASAAMLLIADSHCRAGLSLDLAQAEDGYYRWVEMFPNSDLVPPVLKKLAELHLRQLGGRDGSRHLAQANRVLQKIQTLRESHSESDDDAIMVGWLAITEEMLADHESKIARYYVDVACFQLAAAKGRCEIVLQKYPKYSGIDNVLWYLGQADEAIAQTEESENNISEAVTAYKKIVSEHPDSEFRDKAVERLKCLGSDIPETDSAVSDEFRERSSKVKGLLANFESSLRATPRRGIILDENDTVDNAFLNRAIQKAAYDHVTTREQK